MSVFLCQLPQNTQLSIILLNSTYLPSFSSSILPSLFKKPVSYQTGVKGSKAELRFRRQSDLRGSYTILCHGKPMNSHSFWWVQLFLAVIPFKRFHTVNNCQIHSSPHQSYLFQHSIASREQTRREGKHDPCKALFICRSVPSSFCNLRGNLLSGTNAPGQSTGLSWQSQLVHNLRCLNLQMPLHLHMCLMMHPRSRGKSGIHLIMPPQ